MLVCTLKYRTGTLYTGKMAHHFGHQPSDRCMAGCGGKDGIHHLVSTSPHNEQSDTMEPAGS